MLYWDVWLIDIYSRKLWNASVILSHASNLTCIIYLFLNFCRLASSVNFLDLLVRLITWQCVMVLLLWVHWILLVQSHVFLCFFSNVALNIQVHLAPGTKFDFQKYIKRSLEDDFKVVVGVRYFLFLLHDFLCLFTRCLLCLKHVIENWKFLFLGLNCSLS